MAEANNAVTVATTAAKLCDGVLHSTNVETTTLEGSKVFTHYNGPTDQLGGICAGMEILAPGAVMYCAGNTLHGITNTGQTPMIFYWSKWIGKDRVAG